MEAFGKDEEGRGEFKIYDLRANSPPEQTPGKFSAMQSEQILRRMFLRQIHRGEKFAANSPASGKLSLAAFLAVLVNALFPLF